MRFVAGRGAVAELLAGAPRRSCRPAWALQQRAIGKMLLTGAAAELMTGWGAVAKLLAGGAAVAKRQAGNAAVAKRLLAGGAAAE